MLKIIRSICESFVEISAACFKLVCEKKPRWCLSVRKTSQQAAFFFFSFVDKKQIASFLIIPILQSCSIIFDRLAKNGRTYEESTTRHLNEYGEAGLRTLALAYRKLEEAEYTAWNNEFQKAKTSIGGDRDAMLERVSDLMERELILVGATAVEDKLQNGVKTISVYRYIHTLLLYVTILVSFL